MGFFPATLPPRTHARCLGRLHEVEPCLQDGAPPRHCPGVPGAIVGAVAVCPPRRHVFTALK